MTRNRRTTGFSLIEMLAVIGLTGLMLTLCVLTIQGLRVGDRTARGEWAEAAALERLAEHFRRDVHEARQPPEIPSADQVTMALADGTSVNYRLHDGNVVVSRTYPDASVPTVETFWGKKWRAERFDREDQVGGSLVRLSFRQAGRAGAIDMPIEAALSLETSR